MIHVLLELVYTMSVEYNVFSPSVCLIVLSVVSRSITCISCLYRTRTPLFTQVSDTFSDAHSLFIMAAWICEESFSLFHDDIIVLGVCESLVAMVT